MNFKEMKTVTLLMQPQENGWIAVHKKYKNYYGRLICAETENRVTLTTGFGANDAQRAEAAEAAVSCIFETGGAVQVTVDGRTVTRESWQAAQDARYAALSRTRGDYAGVLGARVHCVMDRPLGSAHPRYPDMIYPVNYGYVPGVLAGDGAEQDVYVVGPSVPLETFDGVVVAVIHRFDDCEDKWVVAEKAGLYSEAELRAAVAFQEKYYKSQWIL
ncbi:MAG: inorganic diphosphatase [Hominenteromicrobium sp.]